MTTISARDPASALDWGVEAEYGVLCDVLLCRPENFRWLPTSSISKASLESGLKFDRELALRQYDELLDAYAHAGVRCHFLTPDPALPYQVFTRDSNLMTPYGAVVTQLAQSWRRGEYAPVIRFFQERNIPIFNMVTAGSFEGGDFDVIEPECVVIGYCGQRTQQAAAAQVGGWFEARDWEVRLQSIAEHYVHIDLMVCMLAPKLAAVCLDTTDDALLAWLRAKQIEIVPVSYRDTMALGCNVVALGNDRVLSASHSTELNARLRALGFEVYDPEVTMFTLGGGGVHCMCQPIRREPV